MALPHFVTGIQRRHRDTFIKDTTTCDQVEAREVGRAHDNLRISNAPILRLSAEIMARIFMYSQLVSRVQFNKKTQNTAFQSDNSDWCWLTITHVCKLWRNIAIGTQNLWTYIDTAKLVNTEQVAVYLERSKTSRLTVLFNWDDAGCGCSFECLYLALSHIHRIRELHIWNLERCPLGLLVRLRAPAPVLVKFSFQTNSEEEIDIRKFFEVAPRLRHLSIHAKVASWDDVPIVQNSTYLDLKNGPDLQNILTVASQNPNNEALRISSLPNDYDNGQPRLRIQHIQLPFLKYIDIPEASWLALSDLFKDVDFPALVGWNIVCNDFPIKVLPKIDPKLIIPCASSNRGDRTSNYHSLEISLCREYVQITAYPKSDNAAEYSPQVRRSITIQWFPLVWIQGGVGEHITFSDCFEVICSVIEGFSLSSVKTLTVVLETNASNPGDILQSERLGGGDWFPLLKLLPDLTELTVKHVTNLAAAEVARMQSHSGIVDALGRVFIEYYCGKLLLGKMICPKLYTLNLSGLDLVNRATVDDLLAALKRRDARGGWINLLSITDVQEWTYKNVLSFGRSEIADCILILDSNGEALDLDDYNNDAKPDEHYFLDP